MTTSRDFPPNPLEKSGYILEFHDEFDGPTLDGNHWLPFYLPHWSSRERSRPNYRFEDGSLLLEITEDQSPWCPEFDGAVKCSSIQTGQYSGPVGSREGQHRFNPACAVREPQVNVRLYTPQYGYFECRARAVCSPNNHVALWMIGYEDMPERSGEINIFEIMGAHISTDKAPSGQPMARLGHGLRKWSDPLLQDEFYEPFIPYDAARYHIYAAEWLPTHIDFYLDNVKINTIRQSPSYPMQFFLSIYELPGAVEPYPKTFAVDYFRAYQPEFGYDE